MQFRFTSDLLIFDPILLDFLHCRRCRQAHLDLGSALLELLLREILVDQVVVAFVNGRTHPRLRHDPLLLIVPRVRIALYLLALFHAILEGYPHALQLHRDLLPAVRLQMAVGLREKHVILTAVLLLLLQCPEVFSDFLFLFSAPKEGAVAEDCDLLFFLLDLGVDIDGEEAMVQKLAEKHEVNGLVALARGPLANEL